jgi:hypothetical protein
MVGRPSMQQQLLLLEGWCVAAAVAGDGNGAAVWPGTLQAPATHGCNCSCGKAVAFVRTLGDMQCVEILPGPV